MQILVVDDDRALLRSLEIILTRMGHATSVCARVEEAVEMLERGLRPDVLLVDNFIGDRTGDEVLLAFASNILAGCLTLLMTGYREQVDARRMHDLGVDDILAKPLDFKELLMIIEAR